MHPEFRAMLAVLRGQPVKLSITSNGHSIAVLDDADLASFAEVEFSLDYPTCEEQDAQRGAGNWDLVHQQAARCRRLGIAVTIIAVMMRTNYDRLADIATVARGFDAPLRLNVYQSVRSDAFALTYDEYWAGFAALFARTDVIAIGEPLVRAMAGLPPRRGGCGLWHRPGDAARHGAALRLLAGPGRAAGSAAAGGAGHRRVGAVRRRPLAAVGLPGLRARGGLPWRLRRPPAPDGRAERARSLLPRHTR